MPAGKRRQMLWLRKRRRQVAGSTLAALVAVGLGIVLYARWLDPPGDGAFTAQGTLEAREVSISSEVAARIMSIPVVEGQSVQAGDVLVKLDDAIPRLQYQLASAADQRVLALQLEHYTLRSPRAGLVARRSAQPGEVAVVGAPLMVIDDAADLDLTLYVLQRDLGRVHVGQSVRIEAEALGATRFSGEVTSLAGKAEFTPRTAQTLDDRLNQVFAVKAHVANPTLGLKPGMTVTAKFDG
jgi:multidrug resistance efflux pump